MLCLNLCSVGCNTDLDIQLNLSIGHIAHVKFETYWSMPINVWEFVPHPNKSNILDVTYIPLTS